VSLDDEPLTLVPRFVLGERIETTLLEYFERWAQCGGEPTNAIVFVDGQLRFAHVELP
jgi:hypothetical protein